MSSFSKLLRFLQKGVTNKLNLTFLESCVKSNKNRSLSLRFTNTTKPQIKNNAFKTVYKVNNEDQATKRTILKTKHKLKQMHKKTQTRTILKTKLSVETSAQKTTIHPNLI